MGKKENESPVIYEFKPVDESEVDYYDGRVCFSTFLKKNSLSYITNYYITHFRVLEIRKCFNQFILTSEII